MRSMHRCIQKAINSLFCFKKNPNYSSESSDVGLRLGRIENEIEMMTLIEVRGWRK